MRRRVAQYANRTATGRVSKVAMSDAPVITSRGGRVSMLAVGRERWADGGAHEYVHFTIRLAADHSDTRLGSYGLPLSTAGGQQLLRTTPSSVELTSGHPLVAPDAYMPTMTTPVAPVISLQSSCLMDNDDGHDDTRSRRPSRNNGGWPVAERRLNNGGRTCTQ